jgi:outer membrane protein
MRIKSEFVRFGKALNRRLLIVLSCFAALMGSGSAKVSAEEPKAPPAKIFKIGGANMKRVFESYFRTKEVEARIEAKRDRGRKELEERNEILEKARRDLRKLDGYLANPELSGAGKDQVSKMRREKAGDVEKRVLAIREFQAAQEKEVKDFSEYLRAGIVEDINKVVSDFVTAGKYDLVLDESGLNSSPPLNYDDLTDAVISALNKRTDSPTPITPVTPQKLEEKH